MLPELKQGLERLDQLVPCHPSPAYGFNYALSIFTLSLLYHFNIVLDHLITLTLPVFCSLTPFSFYRSYHTYCSWSSVPSPSSLLLMTGSEVLQWLAPVQFDVSSTVFFCVEFACSLCIYLDTLVSSHPKNMLLKLTGNTKSCLGFIYIESNK